MRPELCDIIRRSSNLLHPRATSQQPLLRSLPEIKAVLFDIYGTLLISGSGDIGTSSGESRSQAFQAALNAVGLHIHASSHQAGDQLVTAIQHRHAELRSSGIEFPEIDIREIWRTVVANLHRDGLIDRVDTDNQKIERLALEYEVRTNPVWPMPGCADCLNRLRTAGIQLGLISNAQFFTPLLFSELLGDGLDSLGIPSPLRLFSYEHQQAKPGLFLFERARDVLAQQGTAPSAALFIGNDMLKDVYPASRVGFRTALFAGDERSLRLREDDPRVATLKPDLVITELAQLPDCVVPP